MMYFILLQYNVDVSCGLPWSVAEAQPVSSTEVLGFVHSKHDRPK